MELQFKVIMEMIKAHKAVTIQITLAEVMLQMMETLEAILHPLQMATLLQEVNYMMEI
jgi:hypothetical protein